MGKTKLVVEWEEDGNQEKEMDLRKEGYVQGTWEKVVIPTKGQAPHIAK